MKRKNLIYILLFIILFCLIYKNVDCITKHLFGLSCPGCGMTRAFIALAQLDIAGAFEYHPLFWCIPCVLICYLKKGTLRKRTMVILLIVFAGVYLVRLLDPNCTVVTYCREEGVLYRLVQKFMH